MKLKILRGVVANHGVCSPGDVIDISDQEARLLIGLQAAALFEQADALPVTEQATNYQIEQAVVQPGAEQATQKKKERKQKSNVSTETASTDEGK
jgi:hypothetical protein